MFVGAVFFLLFLFLASPRVSTGSPLRPLLIPFGASPELREAGSALSLSHAIDLGGLLRRHPRFGGWLGRKEGELACICAHSSKSIHSVQRESQEVYKKEIMSRLFKVEWNVPTFVGLNKLCASDFLYEY